MEMVEMIHIRLIMIATRSSKELMGLIQIGRSTLRSQNSVDSD